MPQISDRKLNQLEKAAESAKRALARTRQEAKLAVQSGVKTGVGMGSAFGVSYIEARYPDKAKVFGLDVSLLIGVGATAAGALGYAGDKETNDVVEAIGNGALAAFAAKKGAQMGADAG